MGCPVLGGHRANGCRTIEQTHVAQGRIVSVAHMALHNIKCLGMPTTNNHTQARFTQQT
mgnify:CR=1 FL=1